MLHTILPMTVILYVRTMDGVRVHLRLLSVSCFLDLRMKPRRNWWIRKETVLCLGRRAFMAEKLFLRLMG